VFYHKPETASTRIRCGDLADPTPLAKIVNVHTNQRPDGSGIGGALQILGPIFYYHLTDEELQPPKKLKSLSQLKLYPGNWMMDSKLELPYTIECMILAEDAIAKMLLILCLAPSGDAEGSYRRVGLCHWAGLTHEVVRFAEQEPMEKQITII
jgi:hypothetical protein